VENLALGDLRFVPLADLGDGGLLLVGEWAIVSLLASVSFRRRRSIASSNALFGASSDIGRSVAGAVGPLSSTVQVAARGACGETERRRCHRATSARFREDYGLDFLAAHA